MIRVVLIVLCLRDAICKDWSNNDTDNAADQWSYDNQGAWTGDCQSNIRQSPINIRNPITNNNVSKIEFIDYEHSFDARILNTGHTVEVKLELNGTKAPSIKLGCCDTFNFAQFHFHWSAEHTVNNLRHPLEAHLVHFNSKYESLGEAGKHPDGIAVLATLYKTRPGKNWAFENLIEAVPQISNEINLEVSLPYKIELKDFLPHSVSNFFRYQGSLTTPPCSPAVIWTVFQELGGLSQKELHELNHIYTADGRLLRQNYRKLQRLRHRKVYLRKYF